MDYPKRFVGSVLSNTMNNSTLPEYYILKKGHFEGRIFLPFNHHGVSRLSSTYFSAPKERARDRNLHLPLLLVDLPGAYGQRHRKRQFHIVTTSDHLRWMQRYFCHGNCIHFLTHSRVNFAFESMKDSKNGRRSFPGRY